MQVTSKTDLRERVRGWKKAPVAELSVESVELFHGEEHAEHVDHDPEDIEDVVSVGPLHQRTGRLVDMFVSIGCQGSTEEGGAEVDGDGGEPDHEQTKADALGTVLQERQCVLRVLVRKDGGVIEDGGQQVDGGDRHQQEEGRLHQGAFTDRLAEKYRPSHGE